MTHTKYFSKSTRNLSSSLRDESHFTLGIAKSNYVILKLNIYLLYCTESVEYGCKKTDSYSKAKCIPVATFPRSLHPVGIYLSPSIESLSYGIRIK